MRIGIILTVIAILASLIALVGCSTPGATVFAGPPQDAPTWDLNVGKWEGSTNNLIRPPAE